MEPYRPDIPMEATIPRPKRSVPPMMGSGMRARAAPTFPTTPQIIKITPAVINTALLAT